MKGCKKINQVLIDSIDESLYFFEFKAWFFFKLKSFMTTEDLERILQAITKRIINAENKLEILTYNSNPVKASMHILIVLDYIAANNFKTANRTEQAKDELRELTKNYLIGQAITDEMKM